jgi:hypothetical protein
MADPAEELPNSTTQTETPPSGNPAPEAPPSSTTTLLTEPGVDEDATGDDQAADKSGEGDDSEKDGDKPADNAALFGAPEGDYEVALPEGQVLDAEALAAVTPLFKELGLSNEGAGKLVAAYAETVLPRVAQQVMDGVNADVAAQQKAWADETRAAVTANEENGFAGKPLREVQSIAAKAIDKLAGPEFRGFLDETGMGNHPAMMRLLFNAGRAISEDMSFERGGGQPKPLTREEKFYGSSS